MVAVLVDRLRTMELSRKALVLFVVAATWQTTKVGVGDWFSMVFLCKPRGFGNLKHVKKLVAQQMIHSEGSPFLLAKMGPATVLISNLNTAVTRGFPRWFDHCPFGLSLGQSVPKRSRRQCIWDCASQKGRLWRLSSYSSSKQTLYSYS